MADAGTRDPAALTAGYEALRQAVLTNRPEGWRFGHSLLANRGMAAWMAAWAALVPANGAGTTAPDPPAPSTPSPSIPTTNPSTIVSSSLPHAAQIVAVLAQMALAHL